MGCTWADANIKRQLVALAKKMTKPDIKTVTLTISVSTTKVIKQPVQKPRTPAGNDAARTAIKPTTPQNRYPINKVVNKRLKKTH